MEDTTKRPRRAARPPLAVVLSTVMLCLATTVASGTTLGLNAGQSTFSGTYSAVFLIHLSVESIRLDELKVDGSGLRIFQESTVSSKALAGIITLHDCDINSSENSQWTSALTIPNGIGATGRLFIYDSTILVQRVSPAVSALDLGEVAGEVLISNCVLEVRGGDVFALTGIAWRWSAMSPRGPTRFLLQNSELTVSSTGSGAVGINVTGSEDYGILTLTDVGLTVTGTHSATGIVSDSCAAGEHTLNSVALKVNSAGPADGLQLANISGDCYVRLQYRTKVHVVSTGAAARGVTATVMDSGRLRVFSASNVSVVGEMEATALDVLMLDGRRGLVVSKSDVMASSTGRAVGLRVEPRGECHTRIQGPDTNVVAKGSENSIAFFIKNPSTLATAAILKAHISCYSILHSCSAIKVRDGEASHLVVNGASIVASTEHASRVIVFQGGTVDGFWMSDTYVRALNRHSDVTRGAMVYVARYTAVRSLFIESVTFQRPTGSTGEALAILALCPSDTTNADFRLRMFVESDRSVEMVVAEMPPPTGTTVCYEASKKENGVYVAQPINSLPQPWPSLAESSCTFPVDLPIWAKVLPSRTVAPVSPDTSTDARDTSAPLNAARSTGAPESSAPGTEVSTTEQPATGPPSTDVPATETPATETPATETPATETPTTATPSSDASTSGSSSPFGSLAGAPPWWRTAAPFALEQLTPEQTLRPRSPMAAADPAVATTGAVAGAIAALSGVAAGPVAAASLGPVTAALGTSHVCATSGTKAPLDAGLGLDSFPSLLLPLAAAAMPFGSHDVTGTAARMAVVGNALAGLLLLSLSFAAAAIVYALQATCGVAGCCCGSIGAAARLRMLCFGRRSEDAERAALVAALAPEHRAALRWLLARQLARFPTCAAFIACVAADGLAAGGSFLVVHHPDGAGDILMGLIGLALPLGVVGAMLAVGVVSVPQHARFRVVELPGSVAAASVEAASSAEMESAAAVPFDSDVDDLIAVNTAAESASALPPHHPPRMSLRLSTVASAEGLPMSEAEQPPAASLDTHRVSRLPLAALAGPIPRPSLPAQKELPDFDPPPPSDSQTAVTEPMGMRAWLAAVFQEPGVWEPLPDEMLPGASFSSRSPHSARNTSRSAESQLAHDTLALAGAGRHAAFFGLFAPWFAGFRPGRLHGAASGLLLSTLLSAARGSRPADDSLWCPATLGLLVLLQMAGGVLLLSLRPFLAPARNAASGVAGLVLAGSSVVGAAVALQSAGFPVFGNGPAGDASAARAEAAVASLAIAATCLLAVPTGLSLVRLVRGSGFAALFAAARRRRGHKDAHLVDAACAYGDGDDTGDGACADQAAAGALDAFDLPAWRPDTAPQPALAMLDVVSGCSDAADILQSGGGEALAGAAPKGTPGGPRLGAPPPAWSLSVSSEVPRAAGRLSEAASSVNWQSGAWAPGASVSFAPSSLEDTRAPRGRRALVPLLPPRKRPARPSRSVQGEEAVCMPLTDPNCFSAARRSGSKRGSCSLVAVVEGAPTMAPPAAVSGPRLSLSGGRARMQPAPPAAPTLVLSGSSSEEEGEAEFIFQTAAHFFSAPGRGAARRSPSPARPPRMANSASPWAAPLRRGTPLPPRAPTLTVPLPTLTPGGLASGGLTPTALTSVSGMTGVSGLTALSEARSSVAPEPHMALESEANESLWGGALPVPLPPALQGLNPQTMFIFDRPAAGEEIGE